MFKKYIDMAQRELYEQVQRLERERRSEICDVMRIIAKARVTDDVDELRSVILEIADLFGVES